MSLCGGWLFLLRDKTAQWDVVIAGSVYVSFNRGRLFTNDDVSQLFLSRKKIITHRHSAKRRRLLARFLIKLFRLFPSPLPLSLSQALDATFLEETTPFMLIYLDTLPTDSALESQNFQFEIFVKQRFRRLEFPSTIWNRFTKV